MPLLQAAAGAPGHTPITHARSAEIENLMASRPLVVQSCHHCPSTAPPLSPPVRPAASCIHRRLRPPRTRCPLEHGPLVLLRLEGRHQRLAQAGEVLRSMGGIQGLPERKLKARWRRSLGGVLHGGAESHIACTGGVGIGQAAAYGRQEAGPSPTVQKLDPFFSASASALPTASSTVMYQL